MQSDLSTGFTHADLTLRYDYNLSRSYKFTLKDYQIFTAELIGTYVLSLLIGSSKIIDTPGAAPFAIGCGLASLVYALGPISGAQVNPAASLVLAIRKKISVYEGLYSVVAQFIGATFGGLTSYFLYNNDWNDVGYPSVQGSSRTRAFVAEYIQTFALMSVALNVTTTKVQENNSYFGIAIGFVVLSGALVIGGISGACFNPAVAMLTLLQGDFDDLWVFALGPMLGGFTAIIFFYLLNPSEIGENSLIITKGHINPDGNLSRMLAMLLQEFIGTFFLAWTVALSINAEYTLGILAISTILISMIYSGGAISGAHYNPCVTLGVYLRGLYTDHSKHMKIRDVLMYMTVQLMGAYVGGSAAAYVNDGSKNIASPSVNYTDHTDAQAIVVEMIMSMVLVIVVLTTATSDNASGNSYFGLAIGFVILAGNVVVADISGGVFNPAIAIALPSITGRNTNDIYVYIIGDFAGAILGASIYRFWSLKDESRNTYIDQLSINSLNKKSNDILYDSLISNNEVI